MVGRSDWENQVWVYHSWHSCDKFTKFREINVFWKKCENNKSIVCTVWKTAIKSDHDFCAKINIFSVKSTLLLKAVLECWFDGIFERDRVFYYFSTLCES